MTVLLWTIGVILIVYLFSVITAGIAVYFKERRFLNSPNRRVIEQIIQEYRDRLTNSDKTLLDDICRTGKRDVIDRNGIQFSVDVNSKRLSNDMYTIIISVGKLSSVTIGHAEKLVITIV